MGNLETKVAKHDQQINGLEKRMDRVETDNQSLGKLTTLLEEQIRISNKKDDEHQEQIERQNKVLDNINVNLTNLNTRFDNVENRVVFLEEKRNENLVDITQLWKTIIFKAIPSVIGGFILAWLVFQFGLK